MYPTTALVAVFLIGIVLGAVVVGGYRYRAAQPPEAKRADLTERQLNKLPKLIADPGGGQAWEHQEGDYYYQRSTQHEMRYADLIALIEHVRTRKAHGLAKQSGVRIGHTKADRMEDYDSKGPGYLQIRHRGPNGHDSPGPWDHCEWPSDDTEGH